MIRIERLENSVSGVYIDTMYGVNITPDAYDLKSDKHQITISRDCSYDIVTIQIDNAIYYEAVDYIKHIGMWSYLNDKLMRR